MLELIQITNDPAFARRCEAIGGIRLWVDLESLGKAQRQAGRNTFLSTHVMDDVGRIRQAVKHSRLMVRVNPLNPATGEEVDAVLAQGADLLMLPMFSTPDEVRRFSGLVAGRAPIVPLIETTGAVQTLQEWIGVPGLCEVYVGLNDLHISMGLRFMFEPLAMGVVDGVAAAAKKQGLPFGFGGIARLDEGQLPGRDVLAEHLRLGSSAVILSRSFNGQGLGAAFEEQVAALRRTEALLAQRDTAQVEADRQRIAATITRIATPG